MTDVLDQLAADLAAAQLAADTFHARERAVALQWSRAQGEIVHAVFEAGVRVDDRGFYLASVRRPSARGRALRRSRVEALIEAGFLRVEGADVYLTADGYDAFMCWSLDAAVEDDAELDTLPPLARGEEAARRRAAWDAAAAEAEAHRLEQIERINAAAARAEAELAALPALAGAERASAAAAAWGDVYAPETVHTYTEADLGDVVTVTGTDPGDLDLEVELETVVAAADAVELAAAAVLAEAAADLDRAAAGAPAVQWGRAVQWGAARPYGPAGAPSSPPRRSAPPAAPAGRRRPHSAPADRRRRRLDRLAA